MLPNGLMAGATQSIPNPNISCVPDLGKRAGWAILSHHIHKARTAMAPVSHLHVRVRRR